MKHTITLILFGLMSTLCFAQTSEDSVKAVISSLFEGMKNADADLVKKTFADSMVLQTISRDREGGIKILNENANDFIEFIRKQSKGAADERITFETIKIDGSLASVWTPYHFYLNGQFSHCGVNSFQLVRFKNGWKIQYLIDTRRKKPCDSK